MSHVDDPAVLDPDASLEKLETQLQGKMLGRVHNLKIVAHDSGLVLRGFARTYYAKQLAQHALMTETSLPIAANEIEVC